MGQITKIFYQEYKRFRPCRRPLYFGLLRFCCRMLVRWCRDAVSLSHVLQFMVIWCTDVFSFVAQTCHLASLLRPLWHLGGPSNDPGGLRSTRKETLGSRLRAVFQFWVDFGTAFREFSVISGTTNVAFCYACLQLTFCDDFGVCFWMSGASESSIWCEMCRKK